MLTQRYGGEPKRVGTGPIVRNGGGNCLIERKICKVGQRVGDSFQIKQAGQIPNGHSERELALGAAQGPPDRLGGIKRRCVGTQGII